MQDDSNAAPIAAQPSVHFYPTDEWVRAFLGEPDETGFYRFHGDFGNVAYRYGVAMQTLATPSAAGQAQQCKSVQKRLAIQAQQDADKDALLAAGEALSNIAFNLAQRVGEPLTSEWCQSLDKARKTWDVARQQSGDKS